MDIGAWLRGLGLDEYAGAFAASDVDAETLPKLTSEDLREIGVSSVGHRRKLLAAIADLDASKGLAFSGEREAAPSVGERRQVTVLFADLSGFTKLSNELGAEETHVLLNRYFETIDSIIERYGGTIDKHIGDNVMAVFGAPVAHTDDPERAVRAAFDIHRAMTGLSAELGRQLLAHIGIASGQVVASDTGSDRHTEYTVTGDTVNLASRLDGMADPGETLISDAVQRATSRIVNYASRGDVSMKGLGKPVRVWVALELFSGSVAERLSAFVGRRSELAQFRALLDIAKAHGKGHSILIRGEPGIGKTRLVEEFGNIATAAGFELHRSLVLDFGMGKGQDAIRTLVRSLLALSLDSGEEARRVAADSAIVRMSGRPDETRLFLNDLLDLPQPSELRSLYEAMDAIARNTGMQETVSRLIAAKAEDASLLVVVEDIHWADQYTFDQLIAMTSAVIDQPVLLVATSRIEGKTLQQKWLASHRGSPLATMELQPLRTDEALKLARDLLDEEDTTILAAYVERADGNPLFLEHLARATIRPRSELPDTLQGLVLALIDRLGRRDRSALQTASVLGQRFSLENLRFLLNDETYTCTPLMDHQLLRAQGPEYHFSHALVQEGVYSSLLQDRRRVLHARAAEWFKDRDLALHAEHLHRAGSTGAASAYLAAAKEQAGKFRYERALQLLSRALELAPERESYELNLLKGDLLRNLGAIPESIEAYHRAISVSSGETELCRALIGVAEGLRLRDEHRELLEILDRAQAAAEVHGELPELARIYQLRGSVHFIRGEIEECLRANTASLNFAREAGTPELEAQALGGLAEAEFGRGRMISAYRCYDECIKLGHRHGFARVVAANLSMRGQTLTYMTDLQAALADCRAAVELAAKLHQLRAEMIAAIVAAYIMELIDPVEGERWARRSLDIARRLGARMFESISLEYLGRFAAQLGRPSDAERHVQEAIDLLRQSESGMRFLASRSFGALALVTQDARRQSLAMDEGEQLLRSGAPAHNHLWFNRDAIEICLRTARWDGVEKYSKMLEEYTSAEPLPWSEFFIARGRALAAFGQGKRDGGTLQELIHLRDEARRIGLIHALPELEGALSAA